MNNQRFVVERKISDLSIQHWVFWYYDTYHTLFLDQYCTMERATKRHKFQVGEDYYTRGGDTRNNTMGVGDVPLPPDVIAEAKERFMQHMESVKVERWTR